MNGMRHTTKMFLIKFVCLSQSHQGACFVPCANVHTITKLLCGNDKLIGPLWEAGELWGNNTSGL